MESTYQEALGEVTADPGDSITNVGTAVQDALRLIGYEGRDLSHLAQQAANAGLLNGYDVKLVDVDWIGADRSQSGDTHTARAALADDAWLAVHVGGALILRLTSGNPRRR